MSTKMLLLSGFLFCSAAVVAHIEDGDVWAEMPPPAVSKQQFTPRHFRSLQKENFQTTSPNFFDLKPNCEQLGAKYCDYGLHTLGSGLEFASWEERTQFVYTNMARMDYAKFEKAPYNAVYACATKSGLVPFYWSSELTQASRFHSNEMATLKHWGHDTAPQNANLFSNSVDTFVRIKYFMTSTYRGAGENIAAGRGSPLDVTNQWLKSSGHCSQMFGSLTFMGVGYAYEASSQFRHYWTENFWKGPALPTQDIVAGTHDTTSGTNRFLAQVHMSQAPSQVSLVIGGTTKTMALLLGSAKTGTYFVDIGTLPAGDSDGCVPYYFKVNSGRMPADTSYHFLTYGFKNCKRNIGKGSGNTQPSENQCTCLNGTPTTGTACTSNGASMCASCNSGFTMNSQKTACATAGETPTNKCSCSNGTPKTGTACTQNGASMCASCNSGFTMNSQKTACATTGGTGGLPTCTAVKAKSKAKCETCFHKSQCIDGFFCCPFLRKCVSSSSMPCGMPVGRCNPLCRDSKCKLGEGCTGCDNCKGIGSNTWLEWANLSNQGTVKTCVSRSGSTTTNKCTCANGTPKTGTACTQNGASMCASCASGFTMNDENTGCVTVTVTTATPTNKCTCANGTPKTGTACTTNGASMCASCNSGFTMNSQKTACTATILTKTGGYVIQHHTKECSRDTMLATKEECTSAKAALDPKAGAVKLESYNKAPTGCSRWDGNWYFNTVEGKLDGVSHPVCKAVTVTTTKPAGAATKAAGGGSTTSKASNGQAPDAVATDVGVSQAGLSSVVGLCVVLYTLL